jgi:hypothetical protein
MVYLLLCCEFADVLLVGVLKGNSLLAKVRYQNVCGREFREFDIYPIRCSLALRIF